MSAYRPDELWRALFFAAHSQDREAYEWALCEIINAGPDCARQVIEMSVGSIHGTIGSFCAQTGTPIDEQIEAYLNRLAAAFEATQPPRIPSTWVQPVAPGVARTASQFLEQLAANGIECMQIGHSGPSSHTITGYGDALDCTANGIDISVSVLPNLATRARVRDFISGLYAGIRIDTAPAVCAGLGLVACRQQPPFMPLLQQIAEALGGEVVDLRKLPTWS